MKVWMVGVSDCESSSTACLCLTKEIALREMFKLRDNLIEEWKKMKDYTEKSEKKFIEEQADHGVFNDSVNQENMYDRMIRNLSHDDYHNWKNYPHEVPWIYEQEIIDK